MLRKRNNILNQKGQVAVEFILAAVILMAFGMAFMKSLQSNQSASQLVSQPWDRMKSVIEKGSWDPRADHPTQRQRRISLLGEQGR